jgi:DNA invertase Pin-like site-specific DNA recombinase
LTRRPAHKPIAIQDNSETGLRKQNPVEIQSPAIRSFVKGSNSLLLGYARVSKGEEQSNAVQAKALRTASCHRIFEETASGGRWDRPELHRMLDQLRKGDVVVVWKLDRLSRSLKDVLHIMERIGDSGAGFRSITEAIDTTTPAGRMMMQMVGSLVEFERAMIREGTSAGLAAARAEGRIGGRRKKLDSDKRREIAESVISGRKTGAADQGNGLYVGKVPEPKQGWTAYFVEMDFPGAGPYPFKFTTGVRVTPDRLPFGPPPAVEPAATTRAPPTGQ